MTYLKLADTAFGEIGHNGWTWVLNADAASSQPVLPPAAQRATLCVGDDRKHRIEVCHDRKFVMVEIAAEAVAAGQANRAAYDTAHKVSYPIRAIVD